jgi:hypothetical protein
VKQKQFIEPVAIATEPEVELVPEQPRSRTGRVVKRPRSFDDIQVCRNVEETTAAAMSYLVLGVNVFTSRCSAAKMMVVM